MAQPVSEGTPSSARPAEAGEGQAVTAPAVEAPRPAARPSAPPAAHSPWWRRPAGVTAIVLVLLAAVGGGLAAAGVFSGGAHPARGPVTVSGLTPSPTTPTTGATATTPTTPTTPTTTTTTTVSPTASEAAARPTIAAVVAGYQTDFASKDLQALQGILAPSVVRRGLAATSHSCVVTRGRAAVMKVYAGEVGHGYSLVGYGANAIVFVSPEEAKLHARYRLASGTTGSVDFTLLDIDGAWKIGAVSATC